MGSTTPPLRENRGTNAAGMRAHNERLVLSLVRREGAMPKAEIARTTGLSAQTVSVIMRALENDGLLTRGDPVRGKVGQPSVPMRLAADGAYFFGLKIGRRSTDLILIDFHGKVQSRAQVTYRYTTAAATLKFAVDAYDQLRAQLTAAQRKRIYGAGIAMPYRLWDWATELGVPEDEMAQWRDLDIRAALEDHISLPVFLQNDATSACGAELLLGDHKFLPDFLYFYVGYFIGGGLVLNNRVFTGPSGNAGALGSMPVPVGGGIGQLIDVASLRLLEDMHDAKGLETAWLWHAPEAWAVDDESLETWIKGAAQGIAFAIMSATSAVDLSHVIIDGWMPGWLRERLTRSTQTELNCFDQSGITAPTVLPGSVGADARALGAACLPLSRRFSIDTLGETARSRTGA
ncbi:MAG: ROK family transcriptional regulator [Rhodobacteraceae bacterium]|nr:ROK family transcriptional regulator [Paracoccaceae bacterium]